MMHGLCIGKQCNTAHLVCFGFLGIGHYARYPVCFVGLSPTHCLQVSTGRCMTMYGHVALAGSPQRQLQGVILSTFHPKSGDITRKWYVIDATDVVLGKLASTVADMLRGKHKPQYAPNVDCGDHVIIINAEKIHISSNKRDREMRYHHSGYPGGLRSMTLGQSLDANPARVIEEAVTGMMPHNKLSRSSAKKLHVFNGAEHPYAGQKPETFELKQVAQ